MSTPRFKKALEGLNPEQREAVETVEGPVIVIAGPGTGKTEILTTRIANILHKTDTPPSGILALTFTDAGAQTMRRRLKDMIGRTAYDVEIATFHSFANRIIDEYADFFPSIIGARQIDELERLEILESIIEDGAFKLLRPAGDPHYYLKHISKIIQDIKQEGLDPMAFGYLVDKQIADFESIEDLRHTKGKYAGEMKGTYRTLEKKLKKNRELQHIYQTYEEKKAELRLFDYDDAILELLRGLKEEEDLLLSLQERYLYILVDEHQDSNGAQNRIIDHLSSFHENPNLFIVGDDKQAIYRFQGASPENFRFFSKRHPDARIIELRENYRSHEHILKLSQNLINNNDVLSKTPLIQATKREFIKTVLFECKTETLEAECIAQEVETALAKKPDQTIALLYRNNRDSDVLAAALERRQISYSKLSNTQNELHPYTEEFLTFLSIAKNPTDDLLARALFFNCFDLPARDVVLFLEESRKSQNSIVEESLRGNKAIAKVLEHLVGLHKRKHNENFYSLFESALHSTGLIKSIIASRNARSILFEIQGLHSLASLLEQREGSVTLERFLSYISRAREENLLRIRRNDVQSNVILSTVHGVKGLEFDAVCIINLDDGRWGGKKPKKYFHLPELQGRQVSSDGQAEDDERRLLYVALTRARERIILTTSKTNDEGKESVQSRFIDELGEDIEKRTYSDDGLYIKNERTTNAYALLDTDYVRTLFLERSLNATGVNKYLKCPWEYFFLTLVRLPQIPSPSAAYGTAVHTTLQIFFDKHTSGRTLTTKELEKVLKNELDTSRLSEKDKERFFERGRTALTGYVKRYKKGLSASFETERMIRNVFLSINTNEVSLSGKLDLLERTDDGLIVTDFKTGKSKSRNEIEGKTKNGRGDYKRQLVFYSLLLEKEGEVMKEGIIDFVEPTETGTYKTERFSIDTQEKEKLLHEIEAMAEDMLSLEFVHKGCNKKACEWCKLSRSLFS